MALARLCDQCESKMKDGYQFEVRLDDGIHAANFAVYGKGFSDLCSTCQLTFMKLLIQQMTEEVLWSSEASNESKT